MLDVGLQEDELDAAPPLPDVEALLPPAPRRTRRRSSPRRPRAACSRAERPLILMGRVSRARPIGRGACSSPRRWARAVLTDLKLAAAFPTDHPLHAARPGHVPGRHRRRAPPPGRCDPQLDWVDPAGTLQERVQGRCRSRRRSSTSRSTSISITAGAWTIRACRRSICRSWPTPTPRSPRCSAAVSELRPNARPRPGRRRNPRRAPPPGRARRRGRADRRADARRRRCSRRSPGAPISLIRLRCPGPGICGRFRIRSTISAAMAAAASARARASRSARRSRLRGSGRLPVAILGDGDFLMGDNAIWTAVHYRIPLLVVIANNRSFFNDELHQERMARERGRPVENSWIGQQIKRARDRPRHLTRGAGRRRASAR